MREWPDPEDLYHEGVRDLIETIENRQKTIDTLDKRVAELESRNLYLSAQLLEQATHIATLQGDIDYYMGEISRTW